MRDEISYCFKKHYSAYAFLTKKYEYILIFDYYLYYLYSSHTVFVAELYYVILWSVFNIWSKPLNISYV